MWMGLDDCRRFFKFINYNCVFKFMYYNIFVMMGFIELYEFIININRKLLYIGIGFDGFVV